MEARHIPGSIHVDLGSQLSDPDAPEPLRCMPPPLGRFAETLGALGVGDAQRVVLYDSSVNALSARVWWMLLRQRRHPRQHVGPGPAPR